MQHSEQNYSAVNSDAVATADHDNARSIESRQFGLEPMRYLNAYVLLIVVSSLDIIMTYVIVFSERLGLDGWEVNPFAGRVIQNHGHWGMILYKFALMVFFIVLCEEIGRRAPVIGRRMSLVAIAISSIPILWGLLLLSII